MDRPSSIAGQTVCHHAASIRAVSKGFLFKSNVVTDLHILRKGRV